MTRGRKPNKLTVADKEYCRLIAEEGWGPIQAARHAYGWDVIKGTKEWEKAKALKKNKLFAKYIKDLQETSQKRAAAESLLDATRGEAIDEEALIRFAYLHLQTLRDSPDTPPQSKFKAIEALDKLHDPSQDLNLIWAWMDLCTVGMQAHCPSCHEDFPLAEIYIQGLDEWRKDTENKQPAPLQELYARRLALINRAEKRARPHVGQQNALQAGERHIVGLGAARAGKSYLLAMFAYIYFLQPASECWLLARTYEDARSEKEYLQGFIKTAFYPLARHMVEERFDSKSGEWTLTSRWGSEVKIKSATSKGSITARELDACLVAEPGWVPEDIFNQVRARLSSRLGRIIALGTPQGMGGFISRLVYTTGRDPETGKVRRLTPEDRLLSSGAAWNISALVFNLSPDQNPAYVKSELAAARQEMGDEEYETEFEGKMVAFEGMKFHEIKHRHLKDIPSERVKNCTFVLGVDQGPKNFASVLMGYDGENVYAIRDFFDNTYDTMRAKMEQLRVEVPMWIRSKGGHPGNWRLTIVDLDPPLFGMFDEMEKDNKPWPTALTYRNDDKKKGGLSSSWRKDTTRFINELAKKNKLIFDLEEASQLHDEFMRFEDVPSPEDSDATGGTRKNWKISGSWRKDHPADAMMMAMWTILSAQLELPPEMPVEVDAMEEQRAAFEYRRIAQEKRELMGFVPMRQTEAEVYEDQFGRPAENNLPIGVHPAYYEDA